MIWWSQKTNFGSRGDVNQVLVLANLLQLTNVVWFVFVFYVFFVFKISLYVFVPPFWKQEMQTLGTKRTCRTCGKTIQSTQCHYPGKHSYKHMVILVSSFVYLTCWCFGRIFTPCCLHHLKMLELKHLTNSMRYSIVNIHACIYLYPLFADICRFQLYDYVFIWIWLTQMHSCHFTIQKRRAEFRPCQLPTVFEKNTHIKHVRIFQGKI